MKNYNLNKFINAQKKDFEIARSELINGKKESHWMWYMFPQIKGLGKSYFSEYCGIESLNEAKEYLSCFPVFNNFVILTLCLKIYSLRNFFDVFIKKVLLFA